VRRWSCGFTPSDGEPERELVVEWPADGCGAQDLSRVFSEARSCSVPPDSPRILSEKALGHLVQMAFDASLSPDEGRYPRCRIRVGEWTVLSEIAAEGYGIRFATPLAVDSADVLRRLAHAAEFRSSALAIAEEAGRLQCLGIIDLGYFDRGDEVSVGLPQFRARGTSSIEPGVTLRIDAPGELRITEVEPTFRLRGGRIVALDTFASNPLIREWWTELARDCAANLSAERGETSGGLADSIHLVIEDFFSRTLATVLAEHQGGAFAVLPVGLFETSGFDAVSVSNYLTAGPALMDSVANFVRSTQGFQFTRTDPQTSLPKAKEWMEARRRLLASATALASLANVDGCVVLDRGLRVKGFGGTIRATEEGKPLVEIHPRGSETIDRVDRFSLGTRHWSAYRPCAEFPGTIVFVISQDGDLRVLVGADDHVVIWEASSWMSNRERW